MNGVALPKKKKTKVWSVTKADKQFSIFIRDRDKKCQRCGTKNYLTCSHFWVRQHSATRYDPKNCDAVCWMPCHKYYWEKEKQGDYKDFKLKQLGKKEYDLLEKRARSTRNRTEAIMEFMALIAKYPKTGDTT